MKNYDKIYEHLGDDLSKEIFGYRLLYTETGDMAWISNAVKTTPEGAKVVEAMRKVADIPKVMFGAGEWGKRLIALFPNHWEYFVDNFCKDQTECCGIPVISFDQYIDRYQHLPIVISSNSYYKEMLKQLHDANVPDDKIINVGELLDLEIQHSMWQRQYFDLPALPHVEDEIFVDCGCFDGETSKNFVNWCDGTYQHIYAFEPDANHLEECKAALAQEKADFYDLGVWSGQNELHFSVAPPETGSSCISTTGEVIIRVDSLDHLLAKEKITFIKMDVEGSELEALQGAKNIIQTYHPKLAICIYHKPEDIYEIPGLLLSYYDDYVFYIRHYGVRDDETVLYAIDKHSIEI